jgi:hypothetical protein
MKVQRLRASACSFALLASLIGAGCGSDASPHTGRIAQAATICTDPLVIDTFKELMIVHPNSISDARASNATGGAWSFRFLMEQMAPAGTDPSDFVKAWLQQWRTQTEVNGFPVAPRPLIKDIIRAWPKRPNGKLDLAQSPFALMAIVNRMDLRSLSKPNGEGRFVFMHVLPDSNGNPVPQSFSVIFEYELPTDNGQTAGVWADRFHALGAKNHGAGFNAALQAITDAFAKRGAHAGGVNGSSLSQIRTNEVVLGFPWELREFHLDPATGMLLQAATNQTPDESFRGVKSPLTKWINDPANRDAILTGTHKVPTEFLAGASHSDGVPWSFPNVDEELRKPFAKETCNGCHNGEVEQLDGFYHISPRTPGGTTGKDSLSPFLKQVDLPARKAAFEFLLCPPPEAALAADGTPLPPAVNNRVH